MAFLVLAAFVDGLALAGSRPQVHGGLDAQVAPDASALQVPLADRHAEAPVLADRVGADGHLPHIAPGVLMDGDDIDKWLQQQKQPDT
ncbi:hypothetical protein GTY23_36925 [Streptomyces sp. SID5998]|nr:hypothetical protein [Streptomyces sp. SID5998]